MFGKLKNFAVKKILASQLKNAPPEQREMIMGMVEKDPQLFEKVAKEMQEELKRNGNNQMAAAMKVLPRHQAEIQKTLSPELREKLLKAQGGVVGKFNPNGSIRR